MRAIVPLAGPDFVRANGTNRAEVVVEGQPLLRRALESRSWWRSGALRTSDLVFVLRDSAISRRFAEEALRAWYPGSPCIFLGDYTHGAALTALCGVALCDDGAPICIDLADILFDSEFDPVAAFREPDLGGLLLTFPSDHPAYSYAEIDERGRVARTAEKRVISNAASAGVYFFRDAPTFLRAVAHSIEHRAQIEHDGLLYVCPLYNGVIAHGAVVRAVSVDRVRDIKMVA